MSLSSSAHRTADVNLDDPHFWQTAYDPFVAYGRSKTANVLFAVEFDRRHRGRGVRATAVHPGGIQTELGRHVDEATLVAWVAESNAHLAATGQPLLQMKSLPQGAATSIWAGVVASADEVGGHYCENCHVTTHLLVGEVDQVSEGVRAYALDPVRAAALWAKSEELVGEHFAMPSVDPHDAASHGAPPRCVVLQGRGRDGGSVAAEGVDQSEAHLSHRHWCGGDRHGVHRRGGCIDGGHSVSGAVILAHSGLEVCEAMPFLSRKRPTLTLRRR